MSASAQARASLSRRIRFSLWGVAAVASVVTAVVFYAYWSHNVLQLRTTELRRQVSVLAAGIAVSDVVPGSAQDTDGTRARLLKIEAGIIAAHIAVTDADGGVLYSTAGTSSLSAYPLAQLQAGASAFDPRSGVIDVPVSGRVLVVAVPVAFASHEEPSRYLVGARLLSNMGAGDAWVAVAIAAAALAALLLGWIIGAFLTRRITSPLDRLTQAARDVADGHWGRQVPVEGDAETAELAHAFNEMSARTAATYRAQQSFVSDVSHELRTPVTSISGFANAIADGTLRDAEGVTRAAGIIASEAARLSEITSALLSLADLEAGVIPLSCEEIDAPQLADDLRARFGMLANKRGMRLDIELVPPGPCADPGRLMQALSTLIENGLKYARTEIRVRASVEGGCWVGSVEDDGPGVPAEDRERVFDRFARLDAARTPGGTGLGLAICRRLVELMNGRVRVEDSSALGGARFVVVLPLHPPNG